MIKKIKHRFQLVLCLILSSLGVAHSNFILTTNGPLIITLNASEKTTLTLPNVQKDATYIICQAHSQVSHLTLSSRSGFDPNMSATGRDVGVVSIVKNQSSVTWYLRLNSEVETRVMVHATVLRATDPLPGGCNQEFPMENDPNIHLKQASTSVYVEFQWANIGYSPRTSSPYSCEKNSGTTLKYQGYVHYLQSADFSETTYFESLEKMILAEDVNNHGTWIQDLESDKDKKSLFTISSYSSQGVIYTVVVREIQSSTGAVTLASYIPVVTYDCSINKDCNSRNVTAIIFSTLGLLVGLFLCFLGHRFFKTENFIFGFLIFVTVFYQVLALKTDISLVGILVVTGALGFVGGLLLLGLWWRLGIPVLNVLFISLMFGYLFSSILFYTPFANITWWDSPLNYGMTFSCGVLILPVILLCFTRFLNILSCAVVGSYGFILAIDIYLGSGMKNILTNSLRHSKDVDYLKVHITGPFTTKEIILTVVWILLAISGVTFQLIRERKKAPFPPCPRRHSDGFEHLRRLLHRNEGSSNSAETEPLIKEEDHPHTRRRDYQQFQGNEPSRGHDASQSRGNSPRQPLISGGGRKLYGSTNTTGTVAENTEEENRP